MFAGLIDKQIDVCEVEGIVYGLDLFPIDGGFDGVCMHGFKRGPGIGQGDRPRARIADLRTKHEEGLAINHQGEAIVSFLKVRNVLRAR